MKTKWMGWATTAVAVALAGFVRWALTPFLGNEAPFATFIVAVIFVAWRQDLVSSLAAMIGGFIVAVLLFVNPHSSVFEISVTAFSRFGMYFVICLAIAAFGEATRRARKKLQKAKDLADQNAELLRITFGSIGDAIITTDERGNIRNLNSVAESLTKWRTEEAAGLPLEQVFRIVNESTRQPVQNPAAKALRDGIVVGLANHTILIARDGTERPIDDSAAPIHNRAREIVGCVLVFRDITERKQDELKIRQAQSRLESTLVAGEIGTWEFDIVNNQVHADPNLARMFGVTPSEASGGPLEAFTRVIHPDDIDRVSKDIEQVLQNGNSFESEYRVVTAEQPVRWVVARGRVDRDSQGKALRLPGVVVDITQQKQAEDRLRASEEQRKQALDSAELGSWHMDPVTITLTTDERFRKIFGVTQRELDYEQAVALIHPDDQSRVRDAVEAATRIENPTPYAVDYRVVHPDGSFRWVFAKGRANYELHGSKRRLVSFDGTVADITERKQMENDLRQLAANLSEADHRKDEFLATLAHELRNPLAPIRNGLELMRLSGDHGTDLEQSRMMMERQLKQLVRLVDDLMDVSRISQGKLELRTELMNLTTVINSAIETSRSVIDEMEHELTLSVPEQAIFVSADLVRLSQVFMNLLNNSAKYSERNGHIWLTVERRADDVLVAVRDNGIGIAADQLPRIFEMFSQVDRSITKSQGGLGIGLSLVKRLVEMHGGGIDARSEGIGKGAEFVVRLPVQSETASPKIPAAPKVISAKSALRILIVDDNRDGADSLSMMLKVLGNETHTAYNGVEAVQAVARFHPQVILLDIGLPKLNGYEVCRRLRDQPGGKDLLIIAQTGWGAEEDRQRTHDAGFDHHMVKPVDPQALMKILTRRSDAGVP